MKKYYQITNKSFSEMGVSSHKELWEKIKGEYEGFCAGINTVFEKAEASDNKFHVIFSTATQDRHGDVVEQNWDLKHFRKNPVFLDSHNYSSVEHILGKITRIANKDGVLQGDVTFALDNSKGLLAYKMVQGGFLNATSVGFIPLDFDEQGRIIKSELLEVSAVSVPANAEALFEKAIKEAIETTPLSENEEENEEETPEEENGLTEPDSHSPTLPEALELEESGEIEEKTATPVSGGEGKRVSNQVYRELVEMEKKRKEAIINLAREIGSMNLANQAEKKRNIYKEIRDLFKQR